MAWRKARTLRWAPRPEDVSTSAGTDGPGRLIERMLLTAPPEGRDEDELLEVRSRASSDLGDSRHNSDWGGEDEAAGPHAAVAEASPGAPHPQSLAFVLDIRARPVGTMSMCVRMSTL